MSSQTNENTINGITYLLNENGANEAIVKKVDPSAIQNNTLTIPAEITNGDKNYPVTTLDSNAICHNSTGEEQQDFSNLINIIFEGPITLNQYSISHCNKLENITFKKEATPKLKNVIIFDKTSATTSATTIVITANRSTQRAFKDKIGYSNSTDSVNIRFIDLNIKENENFCYVEDGDKIIITKIKEECGDKVIIPEQIEGKAVAKIDSTAFAKVRDKVKIVEIKSNIKTIEKELFKNCKKLTQVTLPERIERISDGAFSGTENLTSLTIPNTTNTIANNAFEGCKINLISDSQDVKNYVDTLGTSNVTFQKLQTLLNEWQYFENITPMYQLDVTTDLESINNKLKEYRDQIQDNEQKQKIEELCNEIKSVDPSTNDIKYIAFSIPKDEKIYKIAVAAANYNKIKNLTNQLKGSDIVCEPSIKAYRQDKNQGPEQYERYLYDFNKTINGEAQAKKDLDNKSPLEHTRNPYSFESNKDEYYNPIYVNRYRKSKENPIQGKKLFGKKLANIGKLNDPEHQGLSQNLKKFARILNHMAGDSQNKLNENDKDARSAHLSIKLLLSKPFKIVALTAALIFAGTTLLPILANFAFSVGMIPGIIASGGLANPAVQHSLSAALYTGIAAIGTGFMAYMVRHLKKKKEQKLAQHEQSSNAAGVNSESQQEQRTDTAGTSSEGQQEQRTDTTGTSSEGQQEETQEVGQKMAEADVLGMINQEFYKLKKSKDAYEEAQDLLENGNNEKNEKINELEETYEIQKEYFVNLLLDYYINYPVKFEGGSLTI